MNENENLNNIPEEEPISTIFSDPEIKNDVVKRKNPKKLIAILVSVCICIASAATAAVFLIPEKEEVEETPSLSFDVITNELADVEKIVHKNRSEQITFLSKVEYRETDESVNDEKVAVWSIEGIDDRLIDSTAVEDTVHYFANIYALKEVQGTEADYGIDTPFAEFTVYPRDKAFNEYTVKVGNESADKIGRYLTISGVEGIYLVEDFYGDNYDKVKTDFATTAAVQQLEETDDLSDYFDDGTLVTCDRITLSGRNFEKPLVFEPNKSEETKSYTAYYMTSPVTRYAANVDRLLAFASSGLVGNGAYVFNPTEMDIENYGLNNPIARIQIKIGTVFYDIRVAEAPNGDEDYYCLVDQNKEAIFKVADDTLDFIKYSESDFYSDFLIMEMLNSLKAFNIEMGGKSYNYSIKENESNDNGSTFTVLLNSQNGITSEHFQNFYTYFLSLELVEYNVHDISNTVPVWTATLKHIDKTRADTVMKIYKITDQRYQVNIDGDAMGLISSSTYKKLIKYSEAIAQNTDLE